MRLYTQGWRKKDNGVEWISKGDGKFSISHIHKDNHGTKIILKLKKDASEFLDNFRLKSIINKYSDHISIPILMEKEEWDKDKNKMISTGEKEKVNNATALWTRAKNQVKKDQYEEFYKSLSYDSEGPLEYIHAKVEGNTSTLNFYIFLKKLLLICGTESEKMV